MLHLAIFGVCSLSKLLLLFEKSPDSSFDIKWYIHIGVVNLFKDTLGCLYSVFDWEL